MIERFWAPENVEIGIHETGFLLDPKGLYYNPELVRYQSIADAQCLVLLGESGIGKTHALKEAKDARSSRGHKTIHLNLGRCESGSHIIRKLIHDPSYVSWSEDDSELYLFLDSLDECMLQLDTTTVLNPIIDELDNHREALERLYLRVACRTGYWLWYESLESELRKLWPEDKVQVYKLAPLREKDVHPYALNQDIDIDADAFFKEVYQRSVAPLACKPLTLNLLLDLFVAKGRLPDSQQEIYYQGCLRLCEEPTRERRKISRLSVDKRVAIAARLAAMTMLSGRTTIDVASRPSEYSEATLNVGDIVGGKEEIGTEEIPVDESTLLEVLTNTGLFTGAVASGISWTHQSFAEFLAARYVADHQVKWVQALSLLYPPSDNRLIPQLHGVAAWIAIMMPEIRHVIMETDPDIMLGGDILLVSHDERAALVDGLLQLHETSQIHPRASWDWSNYYWKLAHPGLPDQLRPYVLNTDGDFFARTTAIYIAQACGLSDLENDLLFLALNQAEPVSLRRSAANALAHKGSEQAKKQLRPLALGQAGDDPEDELKGAGLRATWPKHLTSTELFGTLTSPKRNSWYGSYRGFLSHDLLPHLEPSDLPVALSWVAMQKQTTYPEMNWELRKVVHEIIIAGWKHLDQPNVLEALAKAWLIRTEKTHEGIFSREASRETVQSFYSDFNQHSEKRRILVEAILLNAPTSEEKTLQRMLYHLYGWNHDTTALDLPWMIDHLHAAESSTEKQKWAYFIRYALNTRLPEHVNLALEATETEPLLKQALSWMFEIIELDSPKAQQLKEQHEEMLEFQQERRERPQLDPPPVERVIGELDIFEAGDIDAWWRLNIWMPLKPTDEHYNHGYADLTDTPVWNETDAGIHARLINAARIYVRDGDPNTMDWFGTNTSYKSAWSGFRALGLLYNEDPTSLHVLPEHVWKKWAVTLLAFPTSSGRELQRTLAAMAYPYASSEIIETLIALINKDDAENGGLLMPTDLVEACWNSLLAEALVRKVKDPTLRPASVYGLLGLLLKHGVSDGYDYAKSLLANLSSGDDTQKERAFEAAAALLMEGGENAWPEVWSAIEEDESFGRELLLSVSQRNPMSDGGIAQSLKAEQAADLYIWLERNFPQTEDLEYDDIHDNIPRVGNLRSAVLNQLQGRGTAEACTALQRIVRTFPDHRFLKWALQEALNVAREKAWSPPSPQDVLHLITNSQKRRVEDGAQLLGVVTESLDRLQERLSGTSRAKTPAAIDLWNVITRNQALNITSDLVKQVAPEQLESVEPTISSIKKKGNPKHYLPQEEERISDYIQRHLIEDIGSRGIILNREPQISRRKRTDILVEAMRPIGNDQYDTITAIIEVKGCWNDKLNSAMQTQLVERYLQNSLAKHGLYLVVWFNCDEWDQSDYRKKKAPEESPAELQARFDKQAEELSGSELKIEAYVLDAALK